MAPVERELDDGGGGEGGALVVTVAVGTARVEDRVANVGLREQRLQAAVGRVEARGQREHLGAAVLFAANDVVTSTGTTLDVTVGSNSAQYASLLSVLPLVPVKRLCCAQ
jgi:hypothetical protein